MILSRTNICRQFLLLTRCSGLDVARYDADSLYSEFGERFKLVESSTELHETPGRHSSFFTVLAESSKWRTIQVAHTLDRAVATALI